LFKKEARCTAFERLQTEYGDCWVWMSFDPVHKVIPAFVVGEINQENADRLIAQTQAVNDGSLRVFFSDQRPQYREAILKAFGQWMQPERQGQRGRRPKPRLVPPPDLLYAQVVKHRRKGRVVKVTTEVVFGTPEALSETVSGQPTRQHGLCGTTEQHDAPAQSALHPQDVRVFQEALLDGTAVTPLCGLLSLLSPAQWSVGRDRPSSSHEGEWVSQEVAGGHPDDGGGSDGSRMDSARVADVSGTTPGSRKYCVN
jgi:hypothetical protein